MIDEKGTLAEAYDRFYARYFDVLHASQTDDVEFFRSWADRLGGPALELGVGTGRVAIPLAAAGHEVWGLERSQGMLARARAKLADEEPGTRERLHFVAGDVRRYDLKRRFALIYSACNSWEELLTEADRREALECARRHLAPGGVLILDLSAPDLNRASATGESTYDRSIPLPPGDMELRIAARIYYDLENLLVVSDEVHEIREGGEVLERIEFSHARALLEPKRVRGELARAGFELTASMSNYTGRALRPPSAVAVYVARPAA